MNLFKEILSESVEYDEVLTEKGEKELFIKGITLQANVKNNNGRIYPYEILKNAIDKHMQTMLAFGRAVGELDHPDDKTKAFEINPKNISHRFVEVIQEGQNFITKAKVLDTPSGTIIKNLLAGGVQMGISSRAAGKSVLMDGARVVQAMHIVTLGDVVTNPSAPDAFIQGLMESQEWIYENGVLVNKGEILEEKIENYKETINKVGQKQRNLIFCGIFRDYLKTLSIK